MDEYIVQVPIARPINQNDPAYGLNREMRMLYIHTDLVHELTDNTAVSHRLKPSKYGNAPIAKTTIEGDTVYLKFSHADKSIDRFYNSDIQVKHINMLTHGQNYRPARIVFFSSYQEDPSLCKTKGFIGDLLKITLFESTTTGQSVEDFMHRAFNVIRKHNVVNVIKTEEGDYLKFTLELQFQGALQ